MAIYSKILIPYDGSEPSRRAAEAGLRLAADQGAEVTGLKVISFIGELITPSDSLWATIEGDLKDKAQAILSEFTELAESKGISNVKTEVTEGDATEQVLTYTKEHGIDLIVMGLGGRSGMGKYLGRNAQRVIKESHIPVLVVA